ncbi:ABC transporter ATP-binding protein [Planomonospora venezuelensis]|uniref:ATP-binding cassette subfamily B protein/ATP-binding cassette subfamily C protein n=1 Tax=Planomonospora venezuelensis TaxID=1999 RepID=A0A841DB88_PLAVE|nr:ABC transporter ATP-binding protein [Planomonospora venezuelensis]MBB5966093.1 ATP-binding cassette subfamily B protein/ATP-binding cassette subfamily C protein [Planomonospora venezuelensis]GIN03595.1 helicase [Planomonospora venezuelensis]
MSTSSTSSTSGRAASGRRVLLSFLPGPGPAALLALAVAAATALPLAAPPFTRRFVDDAAAGASLDRLTPVALGYLGLAVAGQAARMLTAWLAGRAAWDGSNRLRERLAGHTLGLDMAFHGGHTPGEMIERVDGDVAALTDFAVAFLLDVVGGALLLCGAVAVVFTVDPGIGGVLLAYCAVVGLGMICAQRLAVPSATRARAASAALFGYLEERLAGAEDLRANGAGEHAVRRFYQASAALWRAERRGDAVGSGILAATGAAFAAGTVLIPALSGALGAGTAVLLLQYMLMVRTPFERLIDQLRRYQAALAGLERIGDLLGERSALPVPAAARSLPATGPLALELDAVGFAYGGEHGGEPVLRDITLSLAPGETLGLVGPSGSGKTTIARLVARLYDPASGAVRVGGLDLREADPASLRSRIGVVNQDVRLFDADVRDNLTLFRPYPGDDRLREVLAEVGLAGWDLDARLGTVSAGEAQLLAFARVLLADPGLVVLDEAAGRLDPATERRVDRSVARLLSGRTGVLIAHRLASLSRVDRIAVVSGGEIVEYGRRRDLLADPAGRFARMLAEARR